MSETKLKVGLSMLAEARGGEFDTCTALLLKVLSNPITSPDAKFRRIKVSNPKIASMLAVRGVKALLVGAGWVEEGSDFLVLPDGAAVSFMQHAVDGIQAQAAQRVADGEAAKLALAEERRQVQEKENEKRKTMKLQIADDAAARSEPGWKAKAAGVKGGREIVSCGDIGAQGSGG